jgi:hypothetical protein
MKQLYNHLRVLFLSIVLLGVSASATQAQTTSRPVIDGSISYSSPTASEYGSKNENWVESGTEGNGITRWFLSFDNQYLYIGVQGATASVPALLYFNTTPDAGLAVSAENNNIKLPFAADVAVRVGSTAAESSVQFAVRSRGGYVWQLSTLPAPTAADVASSGNTREMRIAWSSFNTGGKPATFEWLAYLQAAINNPVPATNTSRTEYAYYYNVFTPSMAPTFDRLSYTASSTATTAPGGTFFNYAVDAGKKEVTLASDLTVNGTLYVRNTTIKTGNNTVTLDQYATLDEEENDKTNSNANGYISGKVAMATPLDKNGLYTFGNMGLMLDLKAGAGSTFPGRTLVTRLTGVTYTGGTGRSTVSRFFFINPSATANGNLEVEMTLHYAEIEKNSIPEGRLSFFKSYLPPNITLAGATFSEEGRDRTGLNAGNNTVRLSGVELTGLWTLAAQGQPLPVELTQFSAQAEAAAVRLQWATAVELNNKGFDVQRQLPNGEWLSLGFVTGKGNSERASTYEYIDRTANAGVQYYRLAQTDTDGKVTYSAVATVKINHQELAQLALYPSPASASLSISGLATGKHSIAIYNANGQRVLTQELPDAQSTVSVTTLPAGIYTLQVVSEGQVAKSSRFVKE